MKKFCGFVVFILLGTICLAGGSKNTVALEEWPGQPLTVTCPWAINGVVDIINRAMANYGEEVFGQPIIATNDFIRDGSISISDNEFSVSAPISNEVNIFLGIKSKLS